MAMNNGERAPDHIGEVRWLDHRLRIQENRDDHIGAHSGHSFHRHGRSDKSVH